MRLPSTAELVKRLIMHIVEQLIAERAPKLMARPRLFRTIRPLFYRILAYDAAVFLADAIKPMSGHDAFSMVAHHISPRTSVQNLEHLPPSGKCLLIANHPTGLADGMAVYQAIKDRRPDHMFLANADALRVMPHATDIVIPVEWVQEKRSLAKTRQTLIDVKRALDAGKCVVIFPSGCLAQWGWRGLTEKPWESSAAMLAKKYGAPVIPLKIKARNSFLYYLFTKLNAELRDITLFHELLNKKGKTFKMTFGEEILPQSLPKNADAATAIIRKTVENL